MDRVVVLTVDEVSVLVGLLDARWSATRPQDPALAGIARRYAELLWSRAVDVDPDDADVDRPTLAARLAAAKEQLRELRRRNDELFETVRALQSSR